MHDLQTHQSVEHLFDTLYDYCLSHDFKGHDPYDGLMARLPLLQTLSMSRTFRLFWIQAFKNSPWPRLRDFARVPTKDNAKTLSLFLLGYLSNDRLSSRIDEWEPLLLRLFEQSRSFPDGSVGWGYPFHWQSRSFYAPAYTPNIVATSYSVEALWAVNQRTPMDQVSSMIVAAGRFVRNQLNWFEYEGRHYVSYTPVDRTAVINANLLAARLLARVHQISGDAWSRREAIKLAESCVADQNEDGSWKYGHHRVQTWIDSFHTGFNLECLSDLNATLPELDIGNAIGRGLEFYLSSFFEPNGIPKYYHSKRYPVDAHSTAQMVMTLWRTRSFNDNRELVERVVFRTAKELRQQDGSFGFQKHRPGIVLKGPYMRWPNAWMFYALSVIQDQLRHLDGT